VKKNSGVVAGRLKLCLNIVAFLMGCRTILDTGGPGSGHPTEHTGRMMERREIDENRRRERGEVWWRVFNFEGLRYF